MRAGGWGRNERRPYTLMFPIDVCIPTFRRKKVTRALYLHVPNNTQIYYDDLVVVREFEGWALKTDEGRHDTHVRFGIVFDSHFFAQTRSSSFSLRTRTPVFGQYRDRTYTLVLSFHGRQFFEKRNRFIFCSKLLVSLRTTNEKDERIRNGPANSNNEEKTTRRSESFVLSIIFLYCRK